MGNLSPHPSALTLLSFYAISSLLMPPFPPPAAASALPVLENKTATDPRLALLSFKSLLSDPLASLVSWDDNNNGPLHYCRWRGVTCGGRRHPLHVVALDLESFGLAGPISPLISNLTFLRRLHLPGNQLRGSIPEELGRLPRLQYLNLSTNSLEGEIPATLSRCPQLRTIGLNSNTLTGGIPPSLLNSTTLTHLNLATNGLTGGIPPFLTNPSPLDYLDLAHNLLTGGIPPSLGNLSTLQYLYLGDNNLEGSIPESLVKIPALQELYLSYNNLASGIPSSLYNLSTITYLGVGSNRFSGTLPPDMGLTLPNLKNLVMQSNLFEGPVPVSLSNASGLEILALGNNSFSGSIPSNLGSLRHLQRLDISRNQLQADDWSFLSSLTNCSRLERLYLNCNKLEGALPSSVGDLPTRLQWLSLGSNQISGTIPAEIGNLVSLTVLDMGKNLFVGAIPAVIGELRNLHRLDLSRNNLSGLIPSAISNLDQLNELYMQENELSGPIPPSIGSCKGLGILNLSHNALGGTIPRELVSLSSLTQSLDLSHNSLIGSIPMEVGLLINLGGLYVSDNQLSGDIPPTLGACQLLVQLHMDGNFFQGNIPQSFIDLKGLMELDLSHNNLSGLIPSFLESFRSLQHLNLAFNDFEGEVPIGGVLSNESEISVLGNKKLCGGYPKLQLPPCSVRAPERQFHPLVIIIIAVMSPTIILLLALFGILFRRRKTSMISPSPTPSYKGEMYRKVSYADLHKATGGFSSANLAGAGSFGSVFKGRIDPKESIVAVKVLNLHQKGASRSFTAECEALRNIRHRNLVKIITTCSSVDSRGHDFKALVFEYMPNGSLERWLHPEVGLEHPQPRKLTLIQRLNIAIEVASALNYLHHGCRPPVVHCDLKPSNILLDDDLMAHVGDFGLARLLSKSIFAASKKSTSSIGLIGSVGYVAPEYGMGGQVSTQGDVYSFGVLLLEMLTGKKPTDNMFKDGLNLRRYVEMAFPEGVMRILDPQLVLRGEGEAPVDNIMNESITRERRCIFSLLEIGLLCSNDGPRKRMQMRDVAMAIHTIKDLFSIAC